MVPCHWGTFDLTDEPIDEPPRELRRVVEAAGGSFEPIRVMAIGERWEVPEKDGGPETGDRGLRVPD